MANGLNGQYYSDINLSQLVTSRIDPTINFFSDGNVSPAPGVATSNYSMRWKGFIKPNFTEKYTFHTVSDDGIRLKINTLPVIDAWSYHSPQLNAGSILLEAGKLYPIEVEYFNGLGIAIAQLYWESPSQSLQIVPQASLFASDSPSPSPSWKLVWADEFNGPSLDLSKWSYEVNGDGGGNNELQYYTDSPKNSSIKDGQFVIQANKEDYLGKNYTSARVNSSGKFNFKYGKVEISAQLPIGKGLWPALWMLPQGNVYGGWPLSGEIDIMEYVGQEPHQIFGSLNYGDPWPNNKWVNAYYRLPSGTFADKSHVFSIEWEPNKIQWFVDGNLYETRTPADLGQCNSAQACTAGGPPCACPWRFDQPFFLIMNVAVGGNLPGAPDASTVFPQTMKVDYVRVYQKV